VFQKGDLVRIKKEKSGAAYQRNCIGAVVVSDVKCELWKEHKHTRVYWMGLSKGEWMPEMIPTTHMEKVNE
jgi:hypothetical protein